MARRKHRRVITSNRPSRGHVTVPSRSLDDRHARRRVKATDITSKLFKPKPKPNPDFRLVEDLRSVPKEIDKRSVFNLRSGRKALIVRKVEGEHNVHVPFLRQRMHDYFSDPKRTLVCIRRHVRKRILFALRKAGKGKRVSSQRNFTDKSFVRCK